MFDDLAIFITGAAFGVAVMGLLFLIDGIIQERIEIRRWRTQNRFPLDDRRRWQ